MTLVCSKTQLYMFFVLLELILRVWSCFVACERKCCSFPQGFLWYNNVEDCDEKMYINTVHTHIFPFNINPAYFLLQYKATYYI